MNDIQEFLRRLNVITGKNYRLPTESEWEFAARGGINNSQYQYAGSDDLAYVGWYIGNSGGKTHPVGQKAPNELGLYDMSGNVWEWCQDLKNRYPSSTKLDSTGTQTGNNFVLRGGSWLFNVHHCRVSDRDYSFSNTRTYSMGFRLARTP